MKNKAIVFLAISVCLCSFVGFSQTTISLTASRDLALGYHDNHNTANTNYGTAPQNGAFTIPGTSGGVNINRAVIDFDWSLIPQGATIVDAKLNLYAYTGYSPSTPIAQGHTGANESYLKRVITQWNEFSDTWNTQPSSTPQNQVILPQSTSSNQDYLNVDVTALVQDIYNNPSQGFGFLFGLVNEVTTTNLSFHSKDGADSSKYPTLDVTYTTCITNISLTASRDLALGYHDNHNTANTNYGTAPQNGAFTIPGTSGGVNINRAVIDFDWSLIPQGATIVDARLNLYAYTGYSPSTPIAQGHTGANESYLKRVVTQWNEFSDTWNTQPSSTPQNQVILPQSTSSNQDYLNVDVTALVQDIYNNPSQGFGFLFGLVNEVTTTNLSFHSKDGADPNKYPTLDITLDCATNVENIEAVKKFEVLLYPNPSSEFIILSSSVGLENCNIILYSLDGKQILNRKSNSNPYRLEIDFLQDGIYFVVIENELGIRTTKKIIKKG